MLKKYTTIKLFLIISFTYSQNSFKTYINEIRANDASTDDIEFIELVGPSGTDITGFKITHYNGSTTSDGELWTHTIGTFTIPNDGVTDNDGNSVGFYVLEQKNAVIANADETYSSTIFLQNGPDGIILYDGSSNILDAVSWEGAGDLTDDDPGTVSTSVSASSNNYLHITADDDAGDNSLQAPNNVLGDDGSGWVLAAATPGAINSAQTSGDISLPVELISFTTRQEGNFVILEWVTESEIENLGFIVERREMNGKSDSGSTHNPSDWHEIAGYLTHPELQGQGSVTYRTEYRYVDTTVVAGNTYDYRLADISYDGVIQYHGLTTLTVESVEPLPDRFTVYQNYPNPFNAQTTISYYLPNESNVIVSIYDLMGREVETLVSERQITGLHSINWDPGYAGSGLYFCRIESGTYTIVKKLVLLK